MINKTEIKNKQIIISGNSMFWFSKRIIDLQISFILFPLLIILMVCIKFLNFFFNKGPLFFIQKRMGKNCEPFYVIKFRTMVNTNIIRRKYSDPLEIERITSLGKILRKSRLDELPQIINVIKGDMSLIGPRPDTYDHAIDFLENIPDYSGRFVIRPGISGLSQIRLGYAEGLYATAKKSRIDLYYIKNVNFLLDIKIFFKTISIIIKGIGI